MKIVILDAKTLGADINLSVFEKYGNLTVHQSTSPGQTSRRIEDADIIITNKVILDTGILKKASRLKLICISATGMNNVDLDTARDQGIQVKNVSGYSTHSVVQLTFSMALSLIGHLDYYRHYALSGAWSQNNVFTHLDKPFFDIHGKRWGIIGLGTIGHEVAKIATAFGANVSYFSTSGIRRDEPYSEVSLVSLLQESDVVSIHAPLNDKTQNLLDYHHLSLLKNKAVLINVGRGGIIHEEDLLKVMNEKEIYVGLDVVETEPIPADHPLLHFRDDSRLIITPHIAWSSIQSRQRLLEGIISNIEEFLSRN